MPIDKPVEYREIVGFPGYRVGSDGSVWSPRRRLSVFLNGSVAKVSLGSRGRGKAVSHLVLEAFVGPRPLSQQACHYPDRDPLNCAVGNLRWGTILDNAGDRVKHGTTTIGVRNARHRYSDELVAAVRAASGTQRIIAARFGVTQPHVSNLRRSTGARRTP